MPSKRRRHFHKGHTMYVIQHRAQMNQASRDLLNGFFFPWKIFIQVFSLKALLRETPQQWQLLAGRSMANIYYSFERPFFYLYWAAAAAALSMYKSLAQKSLFISMIYPAVRLYCATSYIDRKEHSDVSEAIIHFLLL